jgi:catechol 2,3-dioxygenase-like lactoylglutathione lyase family enzyme
MRGCPVIVSRPFVPGAERLSNQSLSWITGFARLAENPRCFPNEAEARRCIRRRVDIGAVLSNHDRRPFMPHLLGIDHVAFAATDLEASCAFYDRLFGARIHLDHAPNGQSLVRQDRSGRCIAQRSPSGQWPGLVARHPAVGSAEIYLRWSGSIESAVERLRENGISIIDRPSRRRTADGHRALSIYFRDPAGNLLELMTADDPRPDDAEGDSSPAH